MSRSYRKAIYKDKGHRKNDYWKVHRRVNKSIYKDFFEHSKYEISRTDNWDEYHDLRRRFIKEGYCEDEAQVKADALIDWDSCWIHSITSNCHVEWCVEPEFKNPKQLVNDYDYCDYIIDEENDWTTFTFNLDVEHREDRKEKLAKMRRK